MAIQKLLLNIRPIIEILRWNKPSGRLILLIPAGWSLWLTPSGSPNLSIILKIIFGGLFVSGFGCIANDIWDKEIDKKVLRTKDRPLASNRIPLNYAYFILIILIIGSFFLTISLPEKGRLLSLSLALLAVPIILIYPSSKRWFKFPQLILSICWGFAVLIPWAAKEGNLNNPIVFFCWIATIFWTFGFDTVYALADKDYDEQIGINSSAISLKSGTKITIHLCYLFTNIFIAISGFLSELNFYFWFIWLITAFLMQLDTIKIFKVQNKSISLIGKHFQNQVIYGSLVLLGIIISK